MRQAIRLAVVFAGLLALAGCEGSCRAHNAPFVTMAVEQERQTELLEEQNALLERLVMAVEKIAELKEAP